MAERLKTEEKIRDNIPHHEEVAGMNGNYIKL